MAAPTSRRTGASRPGLRFLADGGEAGALIAAHDRAATPLGPTERWPQSLKTALGLLLRSPVPMVLLWGEYGIMLHDDAYSGFAGGRHPALLGSKVREGWPEVADFNDNAMRVGLSGGTLSYEDQELTLHRHGRPEQVWMNLDHSPVPGEDGAPAGVPAIVVETTERVIAERRRDAAETALRESERHLRNTVELNPQVPWTCDPEGRVTSYSSRWLEVTGQAPGEPLGTAGRRPSTPTTCPPRRRRSPGRWHRASRWTSSTACAWRPRAGTAGCAPGRIPCATARARSPAGTARSRTSTTGGWQSMRSAS